MHRLKQYGAPWRTVRGLATAWKRTHDAVKLAHANAPFERAADRCDFGYLHAPLFAQGEQPNIAKKLKADARNLVGIIGSDKTKTKTYCQITNLGEQMNQAVQEKDKKKFEELARKLPELQKNLGPEYLGLLESLGNANLTPKDGQEIVSMFDTLDASCPH